MKKTHFLGLIVAIALFSCNSSSTLSKETSESSLLIHPGSMTTGSNLIRFKVNGEQVTTTGWTISRFTLSEDLSHEWLNVTSNMKADKRTINLNLAGSKPGTYLLGGNATNKSHGSFFPDYLDDMGHSFSFSEGMFTITSIDTVRRLLNAKFSGTVKSLRGETMEINDGEIVNGTLNLNVIHY